MSYDGDDTMCHLEMTLPLSVMLSWHISVEAMPWHSRNKIKLYFAHRLSSGNITNICLRNICFHFDFQLFVIL